MKQELRKKVIELNFRRAEYECAALRTQLPVELVGLVDRVWGEQGEGAVLQVLQALKPLGSVDRERIAHWALAELEGLDRRVGR